MGPRRLTLVLNAILCAHVVAVTLSIVAPSPLKSVAKAYVDPMFTQDWRLFAPDPISVDIVAVVLCDDGSELGLDSGVRYPGLFSSWDDRALWRATIWSPALDLLNSLQERAARVGRDGAVREWLQDHPVAHVVLVRSVLAAVPRSPGCVPTAIKLRSILVRSDKLVASVTVPL